MTREIRTTIELGDIKAIEIECPECHYRVVRAAGSVFPQNLTTRPGGCGAIWIPYRESLTALNEAVFQLKNFSSLLSSKSNKPPFIVRLEIVEGEKP
jgi:hypothetical protein